MNYIENQIKEIEETGAYSINGRKERFTQQLIEQGFHDGHTYDLWMHLTQLILPRLKRYKELATGTIVIDFPLDDMIRAFEILEEVDYDSWALKGDLLEEFEKGMRAFSDYYLALWW